MSVGDAYGFLFEGDNDDYDEEYEDYIDDSTECDICGKFYCPCCGCECLLYDDEEVDSV